MTQTLRLNLRMTTDKPSPNTYPSNSTSNTRTDTMTHRKLDNLVILVPISPQSLDKLRSLCRTVHYYPYAPSGGGKVPKHVLKEGEVWFCGTSAFPEEVGSVEDVPNARVLQLSSGQSLFLPHKPLHYPLDCVEVWYGGGEMMRGLMISWSEPGIGG
jgi:hypothetical protein